MDLNSQGTSQKILKFNTIIFAILFIPSIFGLLFVFVAEGIVKAGGGYNATIFDIQSVKDIPEFIITMSLFLWPIMILISFTSWIAYKKKNYGPASIMSSIPWLNLILGLLTFGILILIGY